MTKSFRTFPHSDTLQLLTYAIDICQSGLCKLLSLFIFKFRLFRKFKLRIEFRESC